MHGWSVVALDDLDGDGFADFATGSVRFEPPASGPGRVVIRSGRTGAEINTLVGSSDEDLFGWSLADAGDLNGDGAPELAVAAIYAHDDAGSVTVHSGRTGELLFDVRGEPGEKLGDVLTGGHDFDGDGVRDLAAVGYYDSLVGVSGTDGAVLFRERVGEGELVRGGSAGDVDGDGLADLVFGTTKAVAVRSGAGFSRVLVELEAPSGAAEPFSMVETSGVGDLDGDGRGDVMVASVPEVWIFSGRTGRVLRRHDVDGSSFRALSAGGDVDGDGIGDYVFSFNAGLSDAIEVPSGASGGLLARLTGGPPSLSRCKGSFGSSLALDHDLDGDGRVDLLVGDSHLSAAGPCSGAVHLFLARGL